MAIERINDKRARVRLTISGPLWARMKRLCRLVDDEPDRALLVLAHIGAGMLAERASLNMPSAINEYRRVAMDIGPTPLTDRRYRHGRKQLDGPIAE